MRARTNISRKERRLYTMDGFRGVDLSTAALRVATNRASFAQNFIIKNGINHKRNGWEEIVRFTDSDGVGLPINGVFEYKYKNIQRYLIVHAGKKFFEIPYDDNSGLYNFNIRRDITPANNSLIKSRRSQGFLKDGYLYILGCGDYLMYGYGPYNSNPFLRSVYNDDNTYIPTTTISIDADNPITVDSVRETFEAVNMCTPKRKNKMVGSHNQSMTWTVDTRKIDENSDVYITLERIYQERIETRVISNVGLSDKSILSTKSIDGGSTGYIDNVGSINFQSGKIMLNISTEPPIANESNIVVQFSFTENGHREKITGTSFGILFGTDGNTDRLFISGNYSNPNVDFYSEPNDFSYFPDTNSCIVGSDESEIVGYSRLSDSTLAILKSNSGNEPTIFYRTGKLQTSYDDNGYITKTEAFFPTLAGSIGEGIISRYACANLRGDNLILTRNGVFGIELTDNVSTNERYARERSRTINEYISKKKLDLSQAVATVFDGKYYLAVENICFVADSNYKYTSQDSDSVNYEWWMWNNLPVRIWATFSDNLHFGTEDGRLCCFGDGYADITRHSFDSGDMSVWWEDRQITFNTAVELQTGDEVVFKGDLYALLCNATNANGTRIFVTADEMSYIREGTLVRCDVVGNSGLSIHTDYYICNADRGNNSFGLSQNLGGVPISFLDAGFRVCCPISGKKLYSQEQEDNKFSFMLNGATVVFTRYNNSTPSINGYVVKRAPVIAEWYTPILDLGTALLSKSLLGMTISMESGKAKFGYETRHSSTFINSKGITAFSLQDMSFEDFAFDADFASSYSVKVLERNFNYIMFRVVSNEACDCAVNSITALYKINQSNKGVC